MARRFLVLIFGEDPNDLYAIKNLILAIKSGAAGIEVRPLRKPMVLKRDAVKKGKDSAAIMAGLWRAEKSSQARKVVVVAHRDCDALEPAHIAESDALERDLEASGIVDPIAATPAWEIEAWWMLFPEALSHARRCWRAVDYSHRSVGMIEDAKEVLRRNLRPTDKSAQIRCRDYTESDSIEISKCILERNLLQQTLKGSSMSFDRFRERVEQVLQ